MARPLTRTMIVALEKLEALGEPSPEGVWCRRRPTALALESRLYVRRVNPHCMVWIRRLDGGGFHVATGKARESYDPWRFVVYDYELTDRARGLLASLRETRAMLERQSP